MLEVKIYQTLEDRGNDEVIESHGPYKCLSHTGNGLLKKGVKEPWLGEGYYFWDTRIEDAYWWGNVVYSRTGYVVCQTTYDQYSPMLFDMVGRVDHYEEFIKCAAYIKTQRNLERISFPAVLAFLKKHAGFSYKAIRVHPIPKHVKDEGVFFPGNRLIVSEIDKIQICFFDNTMWRSEFKIVDRKPSITNQTI